MSDLPEQHDQDKSADTKLEASAGIEKAETESAAKAEVAGEKQDVKVEVTEPVAESNPSVTEEKKAEVNATSNQEKKEAVADQNETAVEEKETEPTVDTTQHDRPEAIEEKVDEGAPANVTEEEVKQAEPEQTTKTNDPVSTNVSADPSPAISLAALRPLSPSSRTSTPPLSATTTAPAAKKFSAMNVNKKFLSKTGSPSPAGASAATKLNPLASRPISSPVPIAAPSSRLLSTTLTTVTAKPSVSPQPPSSASSSSPWAKPALPPSDSSSSNTKRGTPFASAAPMGSGQGIASKPAWRAVGADGRRPGMGGVNRDFPTASEVAEGKRAAASSAQAHAEAQAAQAEALMQGLNAFTNFEPGAHRWDDEDDEDDIIDFGDGGAVPPQPTRSVPLRPEAPTDQPVTKSERFVEDFDRSWPRSGPAPIEERPIAADPRKRDNDRVLFNASSNRLEAKATRPTPPQQPQPTKLMSRPEPPSTDRTIPGRAPPARQLPPHLANVPDKGRPLPPHMINAPDRPSQDAGRTAWGPSREQTRQAPPHSARQELPPQSAVFDDSRTPNQSTFSKPSHAPTRPSGERVPSDNHPPAPPAPPPAAAPHIDIGDAQAAEMHTAAEKARLRRQAEEEERRAAADRAKQKAKELEAKFGPKPVKPPAESFTTTPAPQPPITTAPSYTIAQRPKTQPEVPQPANSGPPAHAPTGPSNLPLRPSVGEASRPRDDQWRNKQEQSRHNHPSQHPHREADQQNRTNPSRNRPARPTAEAYFETPRQAQSPPTVLDPVDDSVEVAPVLHLPGMPREAPYDHGVKKDEMINDMLARIKAAMGDRPEETLSEEQGRLNARLSKAGTSSQTAPTQSQPAQAPAPLKPVSAFFDVTEQPVPQSPPPAWQTYTVKLPKEIKEVPDLTHSQRLALSRTIPPPRGWFMSYNPPLDSNHQVTSVPEFLLSSDGGKSNMHQKPQPAPIPLVSIPQNSYIPFVKGQKASSSSYKSRQAESTPIVTEDKRNTPAQHTVPSRPGLADRWRIQETTSTSAPEPAVTQNAVDLLIDSPPKAKAPKATKSNAPARFEGMAIGSEDSAEPDMKSGVRFMVSSELEGDSLLDEVNKMSLDSVEETEGSAAANGTSKEPRSPSQGLPTGALSRTHPSSPNGLPPWTNQREHLKQVWEQSSGPSGETKIPNATPGSDSTPASTYSSGNGPSVNDTATPQQMAYPSQTLSPTQNAFQVRYPAGSPHHMMAQTHQSTDSYSSAPKHGSSAVNGYPANGYTGMSQQGLWSAPAFGSSMASPSYGYTSKPAPNNPLDQKAAMAFNSAGGSKDMSQYGYSSMSSPQHYARSPYGSFSPSYTPQQAQQMQHHQQQQQQQQQRMVSSPNGTYGYAGYNGPSNHASRGASMSGRFAHTQTNGSGEDYGYSGQEGQYYGQSQSHNGSYHPSAGGAAETSNGPTGQGSYHAGGGSRRKMW